MAAADARAALAAYGVDLVDEDDARRILLRLIEEVAHARGADADEHLDEVGTADREERHARLARDSTCEKRLARTRRPIEQHALRDACAEVVELLRMLEELDDLFQLLLRFISARHVRERDLHLVARRHARAALAERHDAAAAALRLLHDEEPDADQQENRQDRREHRRPPRRFGRTLRLDLDVLLLQGLEKIRILVRCIRRDRQKFRAVRERSLDDVVLKRDLGDLALLNLFQEIRIIDLVRRHLARLKIINRGDGDQDDQQIEHHTAKKFIQSVILLFPYNASRKRRKSAAFLQNPMQTFRPKARRRLLPSKHKNLYSVSL